MKKTFTLLLCLLLAAALCAGALAEAGLEAAQVDAPVDETELDLGVSYAARGADGEDVALEYVPNDEAPEEQPPEEQPPEEQPPEEGPDYFGEPLKAIAIKLTKNASKKVILGLSYRITLANGDAIKGCRSNRKAVATAEKDGTLNLFSTGKARITVATTGGAKYVLTLNVKGAPTPTGVKLAASAKAVSLKWTRAKYATGYLVQFSSDGDSWSDVRALSADATSCAVTDAVTGTGWLRVLAILGDHFGGASDAVAVLSKVEDVKVICKEDYWTGPFNQLNISWSASPGAQEYAVYRATLPSDQFELLGTTRDLWYADMRGGIQICAYAVRPLCGGADPENVAMSEPANLWSGYPSNVLPPSDLTSKTGVILVVNKQAQVVTAYIRDADGRYTIPLRHMICSSGRVYDRTKNGTYTIKRKMNEWYRYSSGTHIRWPSVYRDGYYFHSPLYTSGKRLMGGTVKALGTRQSLGCIRLKVRDAEWIYKRCDVGTTVYICDGNNNAALRKALMPKDVTVKGF